MLSTGSYSKTIIKENFSRYWAIPVIGFIALFLAGMLPIMMNFRAFKLVRDHAATVMIGASFSINLIIVVIAITASVLVFSYMHNQVSSNAMHAMPVDRKRLFGSAVISGWILTVIPIVVIAFLMLTLRGATTAPGAVTDADIEVTSYLSLQSLEAKDIYTLPHALGFIVTSVISATFAYAVACLAAVLSGRTYIHVLLALFLFILPNTLAAMAESLCKEYLFGFDGLNVHYELMNASSYALGKGGFAVDARYVIYYVVLSLLILAVSYKIYSGIKLERIGNAASYPVVGDVLAGLLAIISTIEFSHLFVLISGNSEAEKPLRFVITALISSIVFYSIMRMIADSSTDIFNKRALKQYAVCLGVLAVITAFTVLDVTGYGSRVPAADEVASVKLNTTFPFGLFDVDKEFEDPELISSVTELQKAIIEDRNTELPEEGYNSAEFTIIWKLKNGREIKRNYEAKRTASFKNTDAALKKLYNTKAFRDSIILDADKDIARCSRIDLFIYDADWEGESESIEKKDWPGLFDAISKDIRKIPYDRLNEYGEYSEKSNMGIEIRYKNNNESENSEGGEFIMSSNDKNTYEFLRSKGYIK